MEHRYPRRVSQFSSWAGCLIAVLAPIVAIVLYPKAKWLFAFALVGIALVVRKIASYRESSPQEIADRAERLLSGKFERWDVDHYEHLNPKHPGVNDLWRSTMSIGGLPETWTQLDVEQRGKVVEIINRLRQMQITND